MHVDFLPVLDRVQIFAECGARERAATSKPARRAPGAASPCTSCSRSSRAVVADETLLGLPESVRRVIYELLPAPAVGLVAEAAKPLRDRGVE